jgi:hypothetical protein
VMSPAAQQQGSDDDGESLMTRTLAMHPAMTSRTPSYIHRSPSHSTYSHTHIFYSKLVAVRTLLKQKPPRSSSARTPDLAKMAMMTRTVQSAAVARPGLFCSPKVALPCRKRTIMRYREDEVRRVACSTALLLCSSS